jgi:hypothetical protein
VKAYELNQIQANDVVLNSSPLYPFIREVSQNEDGWDGTAEELLYDFEMRHQRARGHKIKEKGWPRNPRALSDKIRRLAPALRVDGIEVDFYQTSGSDSEKRINLRKIPLFCDAIDAKTQQSAVSVAKKHEMSDDDIPDFY